MFDLPPIDEVLWMEDAKCANDRAFFDWQKFYREDQFFDESAGTGNGAISQEKVKRAKAYCSDCPVREACLNHALKYEEAGIWAGTTERERTLMKKKARRAALLFLKLQQVQLPDDLDPIAS